MFTPVIVMLQWVCEPHRVTLVQNMQHPVVPGAHYTLSTQKVPLRNHVREGHIRMDYCSSNEAGTMYVRK